MSLKTLVEKLQKAHKDKIPGGLADKKKPEDFNAEALAQGIKVEMEHTDDPKVAKEIAMDHLSEDPEYYTKLKAIEKSNYGPKGYGMYSMADNAERKNKNTGTELEGIGPNKNVKPYTSFGSQQQEHHEKKQEKEHRQKAKESTKVWTKEEIEAEERRRAKEAKLLAAKLKSKDKPKAGPGKKGEGSRGGKVVRHTKSGKPVYTSSVKKGELDMADKVISLVDKLKKGGPGSGVRGHITPKKIEPRPLATPMQIPSPENKLHAHLIALEHGGVMPGLKTQSGKPVVTTMEQADALGYDVADHVDAMNAHFELAQKTQTLINKLKTAGHTVPKEGAKIVQFHEKKMKEHMNARQQMESRQKTTGEAIKRKKEAIMESVKKDPIKKATTQMGSGLGDRDLDTGAFAQANDKADPEWMERLYSGMEGFDFGDEPREFICARGRLLLSKVDDGVYSGAFTVVENGLEDHAKIRIERITIPELVQLMIAKEWIRNHKAETPVMDQVPVPQVPEVLAKVPEPVLSLSNPGPTAAERIQMLELISKLVGR